MSGSHGGLGVGDIVTGLRILLAVQWSGLLAFTSRDQGSTLIRELSEIPQALWCGPHPRPKETGVAPLPARRESRDRNNHLFGI